MVKFHAIQIQCFVKLLDPQIRSKINQGTADNSDYVTATFRYSKQDINKQNSSIHTFDDLKIICLQYWNIIEFDQLYAPETFNQNPNQMKTKKYEFFAPDFVKIPNTEFIERYCENFEQRFEKEKFVNCILKKKAIKFQVQQEKGETRQQAIDSQSASQFLNKTIREQTLINYRIQIILFLYTSQADESQLIHQQSQNSISGDLSLDDANFIISNMIL